MQLNLRFASVTSLSVALLALLWAAKGRADQPPAAPADRDVVSPNGRFFAHSDFDEIRTTAFKRAAHGDAAVIWEMPGWFPVAALSDDGRVFAVGYPGNNLLPAQVMDCVIVSFFFDGRLASEVRLSSLVPDATKLRRTVSHRTWGVHLGFDAKNRYRVETVERWIITLDPTSGKEVARERTSQAP